MKTLAVIKNELFKDFLKIVSTDDLAKTLDNPDVPLPYECLDSVNNNNSDMLATQLAQYFNQAKLPNKDFYRLNEDQSAQLSFMLNLIKVSSGGAPAEGNIAVKATASTVNVEEENNTMPREEFATQVAPILEENLSEAHFEEPAEEVTQPTKNALRRMPEEILSTEVQDTLEQMPQESIGTVTYDTPVEYTYDNIEPTQDKIDLNGIPKAEKDPASEDINFNSPIDVFAPSTEIHDVASIDEDDPFKFVPTEPAKKEPEVVVESQPEVAATVATPTQESDVNDNEVIASFGIPKNSTLHLVKNNAMTATLIDDNTVIFEGNTMTLGDAAKAALKKSGVLGIPNGLSGWAFEGKTLKELKDANS